MLTRNLTTYSIAAMPLLIAALSNASCRQLECAEGTVERDGICEVDHAFEAARCGPFTQLNGSDCVPIYEPTICDPLSSVPETDLVTGVITCKGICVGCSQPLPCPTPLPGKMSVCGRLYDVETDQQITAETQGAEGTPCDQGGIAQGPCQLELKFYSALEFANNPTGAPELGYESLLLDDCGRFVAKSVDMAQLGFLGIGVDDREGSGSDTQRLTGVAMTFTAGGVGNGVRAYSLTRATDNKWGMTTGFSVADRGAFLAFFTYQNAPADGVRIQTPRGTDRIAYDYYFTDSVVDPVTSTVLTRSTIDEDGPNNDNRTGLNGAALLVNFGVTPNIAGHTGEGGIPGTCAWEEQNAAEIPGVLFVSSRRALMGTSACP